VEAGRRLERYASFATAAAATRSPGEALQMTIADAVRTFPTNREAAKIAPATLSEKGNREIVDE